MRIAAVEFDAGGASNQVELLSDPGQVLV